jgi:hypothetical protein
MFLSRGAGYNLTGADVWACVRRTARLCSQPRTWGCAQPTVATRRLGVTFYFVWFGGLPFDGESLPQLVTSILQARTTVRQRARMRG